MKKIIKSVIIFFVVIIILITAVLASVPLWLPADKIKNMLVEEITHITGRDVSIEKLQYNIFKGIELTNFVLKESKPNEKIDFVKDNEIIIQYNLLAILSGNLIISKFELNSPYVKIIKENNGTFNFTDIMENIQKKNTSNKVTQKKPNVVNQEATVEIKKNKSFIKNIKVTGVVVKNGNFIYDDYSKTAKMSVKIEDFNFSIDDAVWSIVKPIDMKLSCNILYNEYKIPISAKASVKTDLAKKEADINLNSVLVGKINSNGLIKISNFSDIKGKIVSSATVAQMLELLPPETAKTMQDINTVMTINNTANFSFIANKLVFDNMTTCEKGSVSYKDKKVLENFEGSIKVDTDYNMTGNMSMLLTGNEVKMKIKGTKINQMTGGKITMDLSSPKLALEYMLAMFPKKLTGTASANQNKKIIQESEKTGKQIQSPDMYINMEAGSVYYKDMTLGKTNANIKFVKGKFDLQALMNAYEGNIKLNVKADLNKQSYNVDTFINNVKIQKFINDSIAVMPRKDKDNTNLLDGLKNKVYGNLNMTCNFSGTTFKNMAETMSGKGNIRLTEGKLSSLEIGKDIAAKLGVDFLGKDIPFEYCISDFDMSKGKINVRRLQIYNGVKANQGDLRINAAGWATMDMELYFKVNMDFSPKISKDIENEIAKSLSIKDASFAYNKDGWMPFDFIVSGTLTKKKYDYNQPRMIENIKRNIGKKVETEGKKYLEEKAKNLMKNLFGK